MIPDKEDALQAWRSEGFFILKNYLAPSVVEELRTRADEIIRQWYACDPRTGKPGEPSDTQVINHPIQPAFHRTPGPLHTLLELIADPELMALARVMLGAEPLFHCCALVINPAARSRDGNWHRDTQFLVQSEEQEKGLVASGYVQGVNIALPLVPSEDLEVIPGSHLRWDTDKEYEIRLADGWKNHLSNTMPGAMRIALQPGDAVALNPKTIHRGRYHCDKLRRTILTTYATLPLRDHMTDQPWFLEDDYLAPLSSLARSFFERFKEAYMPLWTAGAR